MASDFSIFLGTSGDVENAPAHPDYPWLPNCGSMSKVVLNPTCSTCSQFAAHILPWRSFNDADIPDEQKFPTAELIAKLVSIARVLAWYGSGFVNPGAATLDGVNEFLNFPPPPSARIVSASGFNLVVETDFHPLNFSYAQEVVSGEGTFVVIPVWTRVQVGDMVDFEGGGSVLSGKAQALVVSPPTSASAGSIYAWRWTVGLNMQVSFADTVQPGWPLEYALCNFVRYSLAPERWGEPMRGASQQVRRIQEFISIADIAAAPSGEIELTNTQLGSTAIAFPRVASGGFQGTVAVIAHYPSLDPPVEIDLTAQCISEGRFRSTHNGSETRTRLSCGATINGVGGATPLLLAGGTLSVEYDAIATASDPQSTRRSGGGFRCHHSKLSPDGRYFCGLASRRAATFAPLPATVEHDPPSGVDSFRADNVGIGCYQWQTGSISGPGTCDEFTQAQPFDVRMLHLFIQQFWAGAPALLVQLFQGVSAPSAYRVSRPPYPSGVPGILFQLGATLDEVSPGVSHVTKVVLGGTRWCRFDLDSEGKLVSWTGPLYRNATAVQPEWGDDSTWQPPGILGYESSGGHVDGLGRAFTDDTDFGGGVRMARPRNSPECVVGYEGTVGGVNERQVQRVDRGRWFAAPQTSLFLGAEGASVEQATDGELGVQVLPKFAEPTTPGDIRLRIIRRGPNASGAKVGGKIYRMALADFIDGESDLIEIEFYPAPVPIGFAAIPASTSEQGGNIVATSSRFNARDYANANQLLQGAKPLIGAQPGDFLTFTGADTGDAAVDSDILSRGFCVVRGLAHGGEERDPVDPAWPRAADVPFERGDVVLVRDEKGLLVANLAQLEDENALIGPDGTMSPLESISVEFARLTPLADSGGQFIGGEWTALDSSAILEVNRRDGTILIDGDFLDLEMRIDPESGDPPTADTRLCCWRVTCGFLTRQLRSDARVVSDTVEALEKVAHTLSIGLVQGTTGGSMRVEQRLDRRTGNWGVTMEDVRRANLPETVPGLATFIVGGEVEYDEAANPYQEQPGESGRAECVEDYWVGGDHGIGTYGLLESGGVGQHIRGTAYTFAFGVGNVAPASPAVRTYAEITWGSGFGFNWGPLSRLPHGTTVVSAKVSAKFAGLRKISVVNRVFSDGDGTFSAENVSTTSTLGTADVRLGLAGTFRDARGIEFVKLLGSGTILSANDATWTTLDVTAAVNALIEKHRDSKFYNVFFIALGGGPQPEEDAPEQLLAELIPPNYNVNPFLEACDASVEPIPVANPDFYALPGAGGFDTQFTTHADEWSDVEVGPEMQVEIQLPNDPTGGVGFLFNAEYRHNSPADESVEP